jgi:ABC-type nitrate/sulfonate/bicarbonate transport system substrate-binding protein
MPSLHFAALQPRWLLRTGGVIRRAPLLLILSLLALGGCAGTAAPTASPAVPTAARSAGAARPATAEGSAVASAPPAEVGPLQPLELTVASPTAAYWTVFIAQQEGLFEREGLAVDVSYGQNSARMVQTLVGGSVDLAMPSVDAVFVAISKGAQLRLIAGGMQSVPYSFMAQPEIQSVAQLRGQTVGTSGLKGGNATVMRSLLDRAGLKADVDYSLLVVGGTPEAVAAMRARTIQATLTFQPVDFQLQDEGFRRIGGASEVLPKYQFNAVVARADWLQANRATAVKFIRAIVNAQRWFYMPENRARAIQILAETSRTEPRYAERTYDLYFNDGNIITRNGELDDEAIQAVINVQLYDEELTTPPRPEEYRDDSLLREALGR